MIDQPVWQSVGMLCSDMDYAKCIGYESVFVYMSWVYTGYGLVWVRSWLGHMSVGVEYMTVFGGWVYVNVFA